MTSDTPAPAPSRPLGWWGFILLIFAVQLGLIFWLSDAGPGKPRRPNFAPPLEFAANPPEEWLKLTDPTLFALPHVESFSGLAWMKIVPRTNTFFEWFEEPRWLPLATNGLVFSGSAPPDQPPSTDWRTPVFTPAAMLEGVPRQPLSTPSKIRVEDDLAKRRLLTPLELPSWPPVQVTPTDLELVRDTVVQVVVDGRGVPVSATLLERSGHKAADDLALTRAVAARFAPLTPAGDSQERRSPVSELTWGRLVFEWQTVASTNSP